MVMSPLVVFVGPAALDTEGSAKQGRQIGREWVSGERRGKIHWANAAAAVVLHRSAAVHADSSHSWAFGGEGSVPGSKLFVANADLEDGVRDA